MKVKSLLISSNGLLLNRKLRSGMNGLISFALAPYTVFNVKIDYGFDIPIKKVCPWINIFQLSYGGDDF